MTATVLVMAAMLIGCVAPAFAEDAAPAEIANSDCLACHGDPSAARFIDAKKFEASIHGGNACTSCHTDVTAIPHGHPLKSVQWQNIPETCGACHGDIKEEYLKGIHGQAVASGRRGAPVCTDCHGVHTIAPVKSAAATVFPSHIPETCGSCHAAQRIVTRYRLPAQVVSTYMKSFHGLSLQLGNVTVANCASCHGAHEILPASDPRSSVNKANLPKTCGQCHAGVSTGIATGSFHEGLLAPMWDLAGIVRRFYLILILLVIGGMLFHNLLDFRRKLARHYREKCRQGGAERMTRNERLQHGLLILAFGSLAYTGFALKFPQAWWAIPFEGHFDWRSWGHRSAALIFVVLAGYHLWFMTGTRRGRQELQALSIKGRDFRDAWRTLLFNLGLRRELPILPRYSYVEKSEYWALVWGSIIMTLTGALLVGRRWTLQWLPLWLIDGIIAIHFYEAILACLAILVWHFYFVMFDPEEYPMKWTWLSGRASPADRAHREMPEDVQIDEEKDEEGG